MKIDGICNIIPIKKKKNYEETLFDKINGNLFFEVTRLYSNERVIDLSVN